MMPTVWSLCVSCPLNVEAELDTRSDERLN
jgi:hypothetical protein